MSNIRVNYSGFIAFIVGIVGVFTGLIFALTITRRLSPEEFGAWALIGGMLNYFLMSELIISFWSTRKIARGEEIGRTSIFSSTIFSLIAIPIYVIYALLVSEPSSVDLDIMLFGIILLPVYFISKTLHSINLGHMPHATSFGLVLFNILKIPAALGFVVGLDLGVKGVILAILFAYIAKIGVQIYFAQPKIKERFNFQILRHWLKTSWIPLYTAIPLYIGNIDIVIFSILTGSVVGVAILQASFVVALIVNHSGLISQALYPKLLADKNYEPIKENITRVIYFAIPLVGIAILFSKPALFALNPIYQEASLVVILLSLKMFFYVLKGIPISVLIGTEGVDVEHNPTFSSLLKSKLFSVPTIQSISNIIYISILVLMLIFFQSDHISEIELVIWWALILFLMEIPQTIYFWIKAKKTKEFSFPYGSGLKYGIATISFSIVYLLTSEQIIIYQQSIYKFIPSLLLELVICVSVYLGVTYLIDKKTRILFKSIFKEIL